MAKFDISSNPYLSHLVPAPSEVTPSASPSFAPPSLALALALSSVEQTIKAPSRKSRPTFKFVAAGSVTAAANKARAKEEEMKKAGYLEGGRMKAALVEDEEGSGEKDKDKVKETTKSKSNTTQYGNSLTHLPPRVDEAPPTSTSSGLPVQPPVTLVEWWDVEFLGSKEAQDVAKLEKIREVRMQRERHGIDNDNDNDNDNNGGEERGQENLSRLNALKTPTGTTTATATTLSAIMKRNPNVSAKAGMELLKKEKEKQGE